MTMSCSTELPTWAGSHAAEVGTSSRAVAVASTSTSSALDAPALSVTVTRTTNRPERSGVNAPRPSAGAFNDALLPAGRETNCQAKVSASPSGSEEPVASSVTLVPTATDWSAPAAATGGRFSVRSSTVSGALSSRPSLTTSCATYSPARSATNVGVTAAGSDNAAALPAGTATSDQ